MTIAGLCLSLGLGSAAPPRSEVPAPAGQEAVMTRRASGSFEVTLSPEAPEDRGEGATLGRLSIDKQFRGDLEGSSKGEMLSAVTAVEGSAGYVAIERVRGSLHGRSGSFVLQHSGTMSRGARELSVSVVPDSGTGQLEGLAGRMAIKIVDGKHSYDFEYRLAAAASVGGSSARSSDGVPVHYQVGGSGEPSLVLVHGWALDARLWDGQVPRLSGRHRVVTLDLAGHGASGRQRSAWTMAAFGEDVKAVVEAVGATQIVLVGHSMGGPVVLEAARRMPERVRGIVLVDTLLDVEQRTPAEQVEAMARQLEADYEATVTQMARQYLFAPGTPAAVRDRVLAQARALPPDISITLLRQAWTYDPLPALGEIEVPVRAVNADTFPTNLEANRRHMPGYQAIIVNGTGHYPMLEDAAGFDAALDQALGQLLAARR
jgi:pimeloyl-ACP methyl ester carboxylesterase